MASHFSEADAHHHLNHWLTTTFSPSATLNADTPPLSQRWQQVRWRAQAHRHRDDPRQRGHAADGPQAEQQHGAWDHAMASERESFSDVAERRVQRRPI